MSSMLLEGFGTVTQTIVVSIGLIGNIMTIIVFCNSKLKSVTPFKYLTGLAITDSIILLTPLFVIFFFNIFGKYFLMFYAGILNVASLSSGWLMLAFSYNRYVSIRDPLHAKNKWFLKNTKLVIIMIFLGAFCISLIQTISDRLIYTSSFYGIALYVIRFLIPFPIIVYMNVLTYFILKKYKKSREEAMSSNLGSSTSNKFTVTKMLWIASMMSMFLVPNEIIFGLWLLYRTNIIDFDPFEFLPASMKTVVSILQSISYCGDFFVYCLSGKMFRSSLLDVILNIVKRCKCNL